MAKCGEPIIFLSNQEMDDVLSLKEFLDNPTEYNIDNETVSKLGKLVDKAVEGDKDALAEIAKIIHCDDGKQVLKV